MPATFSQLLGDIGASPQLVTSPSPLLLGTGDGTGGTGSGPVFSGGTPPTSGTPTGPVTSGSTSSSLPSSWLGQFLSLFTSTGCGIGDVLLRIGLFIAGFVAIIGAIYIYKGPGSSIIQVPVRAAKSGAKAGARALAEA